MTVVFESENDEHSGLAYAVPRAEGESQDCGLLVGQVRGPTPVVASTKLTCTRLDVDPTILPQLVPLENQVLASGVSMSSGAVSVQYLPPTMTGTLSWPSGGAVTTRSANYPSGVGLDGVAVPTDLTSGASFQEGRVPALGSLALVPARQGFPVPSSLAPIVARLCPATRTFEFPDGSKPEIDYVGVFGHVKGCMNGMQEVEFSCQYTRTTGSGPTARTYSGQSTKNIFAYCPANSGSRN
jgi:hypothetical protein